MMIIFRLICGVAMVLALVIVHLGASSDHHSLPYVQSTALVAAGIVGFVNLASRQGWGLIVAIVNGLWAGLIAVVLGALMYTGLRVGQEMLGVSEPTFASFLEAFDRVIGQLLNEDYELGHLGEHLAATAVVGVVTEVIHWMLVRVRQNRALRHGRHRRSGSETDGA